MQAGDQNEGDANADQVGVDIRVWNLAEGFFDHVGEQRFADPAQREADYGDSQLDAVDHFIQIAMQFLDYAGGGSMGFDKLLNAGLADAHQSKLCGRKEGVGCHQEQDEKNPQQHKSDH